MLPQLFVLFCFSCCTHALLSWCLEWRHHKQMQHDINATVQTMYLSTTLLPFMHRSVRLTKNHSRNVKPSIKFISFWRIWTKMSRSFYQEFDDFPACPPIPKSSKRTQKRKKGQIKYTLPSARKSFQVKKIKCIFFEISMNLIRNSSANTCAMWISDIVSHRRVRNLTTDPPPQSYSLIMGNR